MKNPADHQNDVDFDEMKTPKGCRVLLKLNEPGFSDARMLIKTPYDEIPPIEMRAGDEIELILKPWLINQLVLEGLPREGDPEKPEDY